MATLVFGGVLEFQSGANGRGGLRCPGLDRRAMRIMAMGAIVQRAVILPVCDTLTVGSEIPVLVAVRMAATADQVCLIEVHRLAKQSLQSIAVVEIMTRQTPDSPTPVLNLRIMRCIQFPNLWIRFHGCMTLSARIEE